MKVNTLTKIFKQHRVVDQLSFTIEKNECVALIGPNGSGKTTTLNMLAGLLKITSGEIIFLDEKGVNRKEIGFLPQYPRFFQWMTAEECLQFGGRLSGLANAELKTRSEEMLAFVGLGHVGKKRVGSFSGGMKQRLGIAQALLHKPQLLILDEPVSALDPVGRRDVLHLLQQLKRECTILFSTHVLHDAEQVSDSVVMIKRGQLKYSGPLQQLKEKRRGATYILATEEPLEKWLKTRKYVVDFHMLARTRADITLSAEGDRQQLLKDCIEANLHVTHFERKKYSLEDAYLDVMVE